jgi:anhydro-N-acetylmuramic acid kinase
MLYRVIGVMSGSSLDGLDLAFVEIEELGGQWQYSLVQADCYPYPTDWQLKLSQAKTMPAVDFVKLDAAYGQYIGDQINRFIQSNQLEYKVGLIASHGHTVFHVPGSYSIQIGAGAAIAAKTALPVVSDLRSLDVALGGQGAPIVPMGEKLLFSSHRYFLNIGGIANISFNGDAFYDAFDVCPANRVMNMLANTVGKEFDENGQLAAAGRINEVLLDQLNAKEFYAQDYPKSLANEFGTDVILPLIQSFALDPADALATYVEHVAMQVAAAVERISQKRMVDPTREKLLVTGGGALNGYLVSRLEQHLSPYAMAIDVPDHATVQYKEALIMALLGVLRWREEETVIQSVTGASRASVGGALWMGGD